MPDFVTAEEYAAAHHVTSVAIRKKCRRGTLPGAMKIGRDWVIPADAPYSDARVTSGKYRNWRRKGHTQEPDSTDGPG